MPPAASTPAPTPHPPLIVISGPSGAGKSTILARLFAEHPSRFGFSVSHTTRAPRAGEAAGRAYHFVPPAEFERMARAGLFVEHARFGGNRYGTSRAAVEDVRAQGRTCVLDIEMEGVKQVHRTHPDARFLFLAPPSHEALERRLRGRGTDAEDAIRKRLEQARVEMEYSRTPGAHDKVVVNDDLERAYQEVKAFCLGEEGEGEGEEKGAKGDGTA